VDTSNERPVDETAPAADLLPVVYDELRRLARALSQRLPPGQTLQPTALVHEAYLAVAGNEGPGWQGRRHFFGAAARAMREVLIAQAQRKAGWKHGGRHERLDLVEGLAIIEPPAVDVLAVDEAIRRLEVEKPHLAEVVHLRFYIGLSIEETASVIGSSASSVKRDWRFARAWLARQLGEATPSPFAADTDD
jgi:RNA polymerase sigma factor (TIGR02999 family)